MKTERYALSLIMLLCLQNIQAQFASDNKQQYASIGNFTLENGKQIPDCKIGYRTFGKLNADKSNAVLFPTFLGGNTAILQTFVPVGFIDTTKFYLILADALGDGTSSSPSNSSQQPKTQFPQFNVRDMVESQYKLLTEQLNIHHLAAVAGLSMGGLQVYQWVISHPGFMNKAVAVIGTPQLTSYDLLWTSTLVEAIQNDTAYHNGNYSGEPVLSLASHVSQLIATTPAYVVNHVPHDSFYVWMSSIENQVHFDWNDLVWQVKGCMQHDITKTTNGSLEDAAKLIKAKMLIIVSKQDHTVNPLPSIKFAPMANAKLIEVDSDHGHALFEETPVAAIHEFLAQ